MKVCSALLFLPLLKCVRDGLYDLTCEHFEPQSCSNCKQGRKFVSECVPKNFAYFHVEFGLSSGFIHVIDDEQDFPRTFGADVIAGVLEIPGEVIARLKRKPAQEVMHAWRAQLVDCCSHAICRKEPRWTCLVLHSTNLTGQNRYGLNAINFYGLNAINFLRHSLNKLLLRVRCCIRDGDSV
jgi:hypothetical protein